MSDFDKTKHKGGILRYNGTSHISSDRYRKQTIFLYLITILPKYGRKSDDNRNSKVAKLTIIESCTICPILFILNMAEKVTITEIPESCTICCILFILNMAEKVTIIEIPEYCTIFPLLFYT